ncbi:unnamed protein product [Effrenium voratum]|nr:unnamed protein product [Effrenium voratum]
MRKGSLMALPQNLGCPCSCKTEAKRLLKWLQTVGGHIEVSEVASVSASSRLVIIGQLADWQLRQELKDGFLAVAKL